jgi:HD-GYP domain-containing protein (c-di-GMP phosphodiesterase class II)
MQPISINSTALVYMNPANYNTRMAIDLLSLVVAGAVMNLAFLGLSAFTWIRAKGSVKGPGFWFAGFAFLTAGMALVALRGSISDTLSIIVANSLIMSGIALKTIGLFRYTAFHDRRIELSITFGLALATALLSIYTLQVPSLPVRLFTISIANALLGALSSYCLIFKSPPALKSHTRMSLVFYGSFTLLYAIRSARALAWDYGETWLQRGDTFESYVMIAVIVLLGGIAVGELLLLQGSQEVSLEQTAARLGRSNELLRAEVERRTRAESELMAINRELGSTQKEIMITLSEVVEFRSKETAMHVARVGEYARALCLAADHPESEAALIADAAPMHDIGKIAIPDEILNKPSGLEASELALIRSHTTVGFRLLDKSERPLIKMAALIAHEHHEQWDGNGYPKGKQGEAISFAGRIVCLCDVYDALAVARPYKAPWELPKILEYLRSQRGLMFDPTLVDAFFLHLDSFLEVSERLKDV